jgi:hypothetical protein
MARSRADALVHAVLACCAAGLCSTLAPAARADPIFGVSAGVPKLETNEFNVEGAATVGYSTPALGGWLHGEFETFDVTQPGREQTEAEAAAEGEAWYRLGHESTAGASFGLSGGFAQYSNDTTFFAPFSSTEEASQMLRLSASAGGWWKPSERLRGRLDGFAGLQREAYIRTAVTGTGSLEDIEQRSASFRYDMRVMGRWLAAPEILALDLLGEFESFAISRSLAAFRYDPTLGFAQQADVTDARRIDARVRLEAAVVPAELFGIVPFAYAQLRHVSTSADGSTVAINVPSFGVGVRTEYF